MDKFDDTGLYLGEQKGWMESYGGRPINPFDIKEEDVDIETIAHSLSLLCRYGGHCKEFYSVAEHCVRVSRIVEPKYRLAALLHDAGEAYLGDVIRPLKYSLPIIQEADERAVRVVMSKFGVDFSEEVREAVKQADNIIGATEGRDLMYRAETWGNLPPPLSETIVPFPSSFAKSMFLILFKYYQK